MGHQKLTHSIHVELITDVKIKPGCISCKTCERICPQIFKVEGTAEVIGKDFKKYKNSILEAAQNCPVQVIAVTDSEKSEKYEEKASFSCALIEKKALTHDTYEFVFSAPSASDFQPGQFATVTLKDKQGNFARCYSIKSWEGGKIAFCIKIVPEGRGSQVLNSLNPGDKVSMRAGMGTFLLKNTKTPKLFIATGTGIGPIIAMLKATPANVPKKLLFGVRSEQDVFYVNELKKIKGLDVELWLSRPDKNYKGNTGRVTVPLAKMAIPPKQKIEVYICGNPPMVNSVLELLQKKKNPNIDIAYELFSAASISPSQPKQAASLSRRLLPLIQRALLIGALLTPLQYVFPEATPFLWDLSLYAVILLMLFRPLHDLFPKVPLFLKLIPLRKELGIFSASVVAATAAIHYLDPNVDFFRTYFSLDYWSFADNKFWAHIGELTGVILLVTSNITSQKILGRNWKRIQRLSYVYFFAGAFYVWASFDKTIGLWSIYFVFAVTFLAFLKNHLFKYA